MGLFKSAAVATHDQTRTFSAPDVFENIGGNGADGGLIDEEDIIMTEPALSRINEPFEPQMHSKMLVEEELIRCGSNSIYANGLINSSIKFQ